ncbi:sulfite exporter TauE/SafE family protein [Marinobacter halodurans]|uniref:Probable membrane transporter protein n=1 Tax=Marinobacter halodurans TaxID=2528979 RepID=A0ABY1ZNI0_9GAMM|nr:sulfite exporter TauE/SafE family protein [Marinobacter halodurans]TBW57894.1 sulfite exporter TauE/SafE family protein [Marinobacter halodurans]
MIPDSITLADLILANLFLMAGACLQGVAGYGIGTLSAPLLFLLSPLFVPGPLVVNAVVLAILLLLRNRASIRFREVRYAIGGSIVGTTLAGLTLAVITGTAFDLMFGVLILLGVLVSVAGLRPALNPRNSAVAGAASGYMGTVVAVGGPPIAMIYQNEKGPLVRANMSAFFLFTSCASIVALFFAGRLGLPEMKLFLLTLPGVVTGFLLSATLVQRLPFSAMRPLILGIAAVAGIGAMVRGLTGG